MVAAATADHGSDRRRVGFIAAPVLIRKLLAVHEQIDCQYFINIVNSTNFCIRGLAILILFGEIQMSCSPLGPNSALQQQAIATCHEKWNSASEKPHRTAFIANKTIVSH